MKLLGAQWLPMVATLLRTWHASGRELHTIRAWPLLESVQVLGLRGLSGGCGGSVSVPVATFGPTSLPATGWMWRIADVEVCGPGDCTVRPLGAPTNEVIETAPRRLPSLARRRREHKPERFVFARNADGQRLACVLLREPDARLLSPQQHDARSPNSGWPEC